MTTESEQLIAENSRPSYREGVSECRASRRRRRRVVRESQVADAATARADR